MANLIEDYLREVSATLRVAPDRKRQILDELRTHLREKLDDERSQDPDAPVGDVERRVLADFGSPRDLALAYEPEGQVVLKNSAGDIVLRVGRAVGRGTGRVVKWTAITLAALLVIAIGVGIWAFYEVRPLVETMASQAMPVYDYEETCPQTPCNGANGRDIFFVGNNTKEVRLTVNVAPPWRDEGNGTGRVYVVLFDPAHARVFERNFTVTNESSGSREIRFASFPGNWTVEVEYFEFRGEVRVEAYAYALGWRDL